MLWKTVWFTTMLLISTSALTLRSASVIDHEPVEVLTETSISPEQSAPIGKNPLSVESEVILSTKTNENQIPTTSRTPLTFESSDDTVKVNSQSEITSIDNSENEQPTIDNSPEESNMVVPSPEIICNNEDEECDDDENAEGDNISEGDDGRDDDDPVGDGDEDGKNANGDEKNEDSTGNEDLIVETKSGLVQGFDWQGNHNITSFIDIPYGNITHPFQAATTVNAWGTVHTVKDHNKRCPQLQENKFVGDTDCLTLSIFKPLDAKDASVLFHIHAGFDTGSGDPFIYGPEYLVGNGIILVLPNYRLGPFGFLCMQNETAPGNMALKDLSLALSWISENIAAFGGDSKNIAVSGDGKSGALAGLLALSSLSKDYVSKVIVESGSFLSYWALDRDPLSKAVELFEKLTDAENTPSGIKISLQDLVTSAIATAAKSIQFGPCLEQNSTTAFIVETPYTIITNEKFEKTSFVIGSAMYAGVHEALLQTEETIQKLNEDFTLFLPEDLTFATITLKTQAGEKVKTQYFGNEAIRIDAVEDLSLCFTDMGYLGPGIRSARLLVDAGATVYFYEFAFVGDMNRVLESLNHPVEGAVRGDIVGYLFTQDGVVPGEHQAGERKIIETLTQMWTSFLKTGAPSTDSIEWKKLENKDDLKEEWLLINSEPEMTKGMHVDRMSLWTDIYAKHYIDGNHGHELSSSVYTVLMLQIIFWLLFCRNVSHVY